MKYIKAFVCFALSCVQVSCHVYRIDHIQRYEQQESHDKLITALTHSSDTYIRTQAAQSLGRLRSQKAIPVLLTTLQDKYWGVRLYSAQALGLINNKSTIQPLEAQLKKEEDVHVRSAITTALDTLTAS